MSPHSENENEAQSENDISLSENDAQSENDIILCENEFCYVVSLGSCYFKIRWIESGIFCKDKICFS